VGSSVRRKIDTILSPPERPGEAPSAWQGTASTPRPGSGWPRYHHPCLDHSAPNCGPPPALGGREERAAPECRPLGGHSAESPSSPVPRTPGP